MIEINKLYGVLLGMAVEDVPAAYSWYIKKFTTVATSEKVQNILKVLLKTVPLDKRVVFACLVCNAILSTVFGPEIKKLDPVNTYIPVKRPPDSEDSDNNFCLVSMTEPASAYKALLQYLDPDIKEKLTAPTWIEYIAAGCLQILRELKNV